MNTFYNVLILLSLTFSLNGQGNSEPSEYFGASDSIFVQVSPIDDNSTLVYYPYTLKPKNTLYSLSKYFGISIEDIKKLNPPLLVKMPQLGDTIHIPIYYNRLAQNTDDKENRTSIYYCVKKGETLYTIAKKYFDTSVEDFEKNAQINSHLLDIGQKLRLGYLSNDNLLIPQAEPDYHGFKEKIPSDSVVHYIDQKGIAVWKDGPKNGKQYVLHRQAKIGSRVQVINPMFNSKVNAKVVGRLPEKMYLDDVTIVLSSEAARSLGALDKRFYVKIRYIK